VGLPVAGIPLGDLGIFPGRRRVVPMLIEEVSAAAEGVDRPLATPAQEHEDQHAQ
jgi:hypothetical protein